MLPYCGEENARSVLRSMALHAGGAAAPQVVVMVEQPTDPELLQLLEWVDLLGGSIPDVTLSPQAWAERQASGQAVGSSQQQQPPLPSHTADLLVAWAVVEHLPAGEQLTSKGAALSELLAHTTWAARGVQLPRRHVPAAAAGAGAAINFVAVDGSSKGAAAVPGPSGALQQLVSQLAAWPRRPFARPVSETDWLAGVERVWGKVQRSRELLAMLVMQLRSRYAGAGGWKLRGSAV